MWIFSLITVLVGYFLGNFNGAICISKIYGDDVRAHGSGNAGLTNFIRSYGAGRAVLVILIDGGKAVLACVLGGLLMQKYQGFQSGAALGGAAVMLGHVLPVLLDFRGGKGILSALFIAIVVDWRIAVMGLAVFAIAYLCTRYVSLGSVLGAVTYGVAFSVLHYNHMVVLVCGLFMSLLAILMHWGNIVRLLKGQERKTNLFKKSKE